MRMILPTTALALLFAVSPASAMMCGGGQQQAQVSGNAVSTGMMCGAVGAAQDDPMADKKPEPKQQSAMCPCCRNMAMMRGGMQHQNMPGMDMPKQ